MVIGRTDVRPSPSSASVRSSRAQTVQPASGTTSVHGLRSHHATCPPTHWLIDDYYDPDPKATDKTYCKRGAFLGPTAFDPIEFGIPPSTIPATDTAQLLALIVAKHVLADASRTSLRHDRSRTRSSVILGVASATELVVSMGGSLAATGVGQGAARERTARSKGLRRSANASPIRTCRGRRATFPGLLGNVVAGRHRQRLRPRRHQLRRGRSLREFAFRARDGRQRTASSVKPTW